MLPTHRTLKATITATLASAGLLAAPSAAGAAVTVTITADGTGTKPLTAASLRVTDPSPTINAARTGDTQGFDLTITGPDAKPTTYSDCSAIPVSQKLAFRGNGAYVVSVKPVNVTQGCVAAGPEQLLRFEIQAGAGISAPSSVLLMRHASSKTSIVYPFRLAFPFKAKPEVTFARGSVSASPDGTTVPGAKDILSGASAPDERTGTVNLAFPAAGIYSVFARARIDGKRLTPWSAPTVVKVISPFEVDKVRFLDRTGPSYRVAGYFANKATTGRIVIDVARGSRQTKKPKKSREYRRLGTVTIKNGRFTKRFRTHRRGLHRLRFSFGGVDMVAPGNAVTKVRFGSRAR